MPNPNTTPRVIVPSIDTFIFDFDGTIADSFTTIVAICNQMAQEFGYHVASDSEIDHLRNLNSRQIIKQSSISVLKLPMLIRRLKMELNHVVHTLTPIAGIPEALSSLKQQGYQLGILTSNGRENVEAFLHSNAMLHLFDFIYSGATLFGKSRLIHQCLRQQNLSPSQVVYVGDETRDIEAARKISIRAVAVAWGFNTATVLSNHQPDFLLSDPAELLQIARVLDG